MANRSITRRALITREQLQTLRFDVTSSRLATAGLQQLMPAGESKLTLARAANLVNVIDLDAIVVFIWASLSRDDDRVTQKDVGEAIDRELRLGTKLGDFREPIIAGLEAAGLVQRNIVAEDDAEGEGDAARPRLATGA